MNHGTCTHVSLSIHVIYVYCVYVCLCQCVHAWYGYTYTNTHSRKFVTDTYTRAHIDTDRLHERPLMCVCVWILVNVHTCPFACISCTCIVSMLVCFNMQMYNIDMYLIGVTLHTYTDTRAVNTYTHVHTSIQTDYMSDRSCVCVCINRGTCMHVFFRMYVVYIYCVWCVCVNV